MCGWPFESGTGGIGPIRHASRAPILNAIRAWRFHQSNDALSVALDGKRPPQISEKRHDLLFVAEPQRSIKNELLATEPVCITLPMRTSSAPPPTPPNDRVATRSCAADVPDYKRFIPTRGDHFVGLHRSAVMSCLQCLQAITGPRRGWEGYRARKAKSTTSTTRNSAIIFWPQPALSLVTRASSRFCPVEKRAGIRSVDQSLSLHFLASARAA